MGAGASIITQPNTDQLVRQLSSITNSLVTTGIAAVSHAVHTTIHLTRRALSSKDPWRLTDYRKSDLHTIPHHHLTLSLLFAELSSCIYLGPSEWLACPTTNPTINLLKKMPHAISSLSMPIRFLLGDLSISSGSRVTPLKDPFVMNQDVKETNNSNCTFVNGIFRSKSGCVSGMLLELDADINNNTTSIVLIFCGSQSVIDTISSSQFLQSQDPTDENGNGSIHSGFAKAYEEIRGSFLQQMRTLFLQSTGKHNQRKLYICGHSMGGVFATLVAKDLHLNFHADIDETTVFTYGCPRIGDSIWQKEYPSSIRHYRYVHGNDIVPSAPPEWMGYVHVGEEIRLDDHGLWRKQKNGVEEVTLVVTSGTSTSTVVMGEIIKDDGDVNNEESLDMSATPVAQVVTVPEQVTSSAVVVVQGHRPTTRFERFVDVLKSSPLIDHRILSYVRHLRECVAHVEISEKRLDEIYNQEMAMEVSLVMKKDKTMEEKIQEIWKHELKNGGSVPVPAAALHILRERKREMKGTLSSTTSFLSEVLVCGWELWYDRNERKRHIAQRFVRNEYKWFQCVLLPPVIDLYEALLLIQKGNGMNSRTSKCTESTSSVSNVNRDEVIRELKDLGCLDPEGGVGRREMLIWMMWKNGRMEELNS